MSNKARFHTSSTPEFLAVRELRHGLSHSKSQWFRIAEDIEPRVQHETDCGWKYENCNMLFVNISEEYEAVRARRDDHRLTPKPSFLQYQNRRRVDRRCDMNALDCWYWLLWTVLADRLKLLLQKHCQPHQIAYLWICRTEMSCHSWQSWRYQKPQEEDWTLIPTRPWNWEFRVRHQKSIAFFGRL